MTAAETIAIAAEDRLRADLYNYLGVMLSGPPDATLLKQTAGLGGDATPLGEAMTALARVARVTPPAKARREFDALFIGLGRGELLPYASYYLTGFLNEKPLARLRADMRALGVVREQHVYEPEDNIASLMEMMGGMIVGRFGAPVPLSRQQDFFATHIAPWAGHFFADLEGAKASVLYASLGAAGKAFIEIEREGFRLSAA